MKIFLEALIQCLEIFYVARNGGNNQVEKTVFACVHVCVKTQRYT